MSSTTSTRSAPRPLQLGSSSISAAPTPGPSSAPIGSDLAARKAPRRQSSISYKTNATSPRTDSASSRGASNESRVLAVQDTEPASSRSPPARDLEPATLAEKHADLLRFIAQKESRCLELRTQLAQHEADLLLLKRKWERIVSKGGPRTQGDRNDVLEGIREGVQSGIGKVFAALEPAAGAASQTRTKPTSSTPSAVSATTSSPSPMIPNKDPSPSIVSPRTRSSLSRSASSVGSLFDDIAGSEYQSSASSIMDSPVMKADADPSSVVSPRHSQADKRNSDNSGSMKAGPAIQADDNPAAKRRRERPASVHVARPAATSPTSSAGTPLGKQVSAWVPELNKKWEELKSNETLSKQSKRASVLLNDVLSVLVAPASSQALWHTPSHTVLDSAFFEPAVAASIGAGSGSGSGPNAGPGASQSLLDEEADESEGTVGKVLQPEIKSSPVMQVSKEDDEEWNW